jgi:hypothetical protein
MRKTITLIFGLAVTLSAPCAIRAAAVDTFHIVVLSSRPETVSGGDALVRIEAPQGESLDKVIVTVNGRDVTGALHRDPAAHALTGLVTGLKIGENSLQVFSGTGQTQPAEKLTLKNHAISGPVFSGPQEQPFVCQTEDFKLPDGTSLGAPFDVNCSVKTVVTYVYKSAAPPLPAPNGRPAAPAFSRLPSMTSLPSDVAWTTTSRGEKVPYVVRVETGTINRSIYEFAVLHDPTKESAPSPLAPPKAWNKRLLYSFGGGCTGGWFKQGASLGNVISDAIVGKGYAEASATLNVFGNNCNEVIAAETMMMVKERFIKACGKPLFTMSRGGSGGAEQQLPIADNYPGLLDGIIPSLTFPDVLANAQMILDANLLNSYFTKVAGALTEQQKLAIEGTARLKDFTGDASRINPSVPCPPQLTKDQRYDPVSNRSGARCDVFDHAVNVYGRDPSTGFARRPLDNTGVQYGLAALDGGTITPAQFLDLNEKIGGYDNDGNIAVARSVADPLALRAAYQTGRVTNGGLGLTQVPIIDVRPYRDALPNGDVHLKFHSFSLRERLHGANGTFANDVLLVGPVAPAGQAPASPSMDQYAMEKMDEWLTNLTKDVSADPMMKKIARAKPADLVDSCYTASGERIVEQQTATGGKCNELYPTFMPPRMVAGGPASNDVLKCQLKPIDKKDYKTTFTAAEQARLAAIFPAGVCDWSKPGVEQKPPAITWRSF